MDMNGPNPAEERVKQERNVPEGAGWLWGESENPDRRDFSSEIAFGDHKIAFAVKHAAGKDVLDLGCVQHNPENYRSRFWLHKALVYVANSVTGVDLYAPGVEYLRGKGFNVQVGDVQDLQLERSFDVIVAGDLIEHLDNFGGFLKGCRRHLSEEGKLLISTPNPWYWKNLVKAAIHREVNNNPEHTCWLCPRTLRQLVARYGFDIVEVQFGSRYLRDKMMPLPSGWKHTSFHCVICKTKKVSRP